MEIYNAKKDSITGKEASRSIKKNQLYEVEYKKSQYKVQLQIWRPFILCIKVTLVFFIVASSQYLIYISGIFWIIGSKVLFTFCCFTMCSFTKSKMEVVLHFSTLKMQFVMRARRCLTAASFNTTLQFDLITRYLSLDLAHEI